jgi:hypothetical protein
MPQVNESLLYIYFFDAAKPKTKCRAEKNVLSSLSRRRSSKGVACSSFPTLPCHPRRSKKGDTSSRIGLKKCNEKLTPFEHATCSRRLLQLIEIKVCKARGEREREREREKSPRSLLLLPPRVLLFVFTERAEWGLEKSRLLSLYLGVAL